MKSLPAKIVARIVHPITLRWASYAYRKTINSAHASFEGMAAELGKSIADGLETAEIIDIIVKGISFHHPSNNLIEYAIGRELMEAINIRHIEVGGTAQDTKVHCYFDLTRNDSSMDFPSLVEAMLFAGEFVRF